MIFVLVVGVVVLASGGLLLLKRRQRTPRELRGDWWPEFEREFRAYAARAADLPRDATRRRERRPEGP
jgi:hypothetical protein